MTPSLQIPATTSLHARNACVRAPLAIKAVSPSVEERANEKSSSANLPILDFVASDESLDRFGEIICASGWRLDTYRRNPVFQNAHQYGDILFTLGKALITEVRPGGTSSTSPHDTSSPQHSSATAHPALRTSHLYQRIEFATDVNPVARIAYGLYKGHFLNAVSVGFLPLRWEDIPPEKASSLGAPASRRRVAGPEEARAGETPAFPGTRPRAASASGRRLRRRYLEQELLEVSAVGIPANPNALALGLKAGAVDKSDLRELLNLLKSLCVGPNSWECRRPGGHLSSFQRELAGETPALPEQGRAPLLSNSDLLLFARQLHGILRHA